MQQPPVGPRSLFYGGSSSSNDPFYGKVRALCGSRPLCTLAFVRLWRISCPEGQGGCGIGADSGSHFGRTAVWSGFFRRAAVCSMIPLFSRRRARCWWQRRRRPRFCRPAFFSRGVSVLSNALWYGLEKSFRYRRSTLRTVRFDMYAGRRGDWQKKLTVCLKEIELLRCIISDGGRAFEKEVSFWNENRLLLGSRRDAFFP